MTDATVEIEIIPELSDIDKLKTHMSWLWSAIEEIYQRLDDLEIITEIAEPEECDDRA